MLKGLKIIRPNQVWAADITYIQLVKGFCYLVAIIDWFNRYVLSWRLSNTLEADFCVECAEEALSYGHPDIFNTDQGVQFTSKDFTQKLLDKQVRISMDGRDRGVYSSFRTLAVAKSSALSMSTKQAKIWL